MSPEQVEGRALDGRSDQFSLGVVLYEAFSGERAFYRSGGAQNILAQVVTGQPLAPLRTVAPDLDHGLCAVIERATAMPTASRIQPIAQKIANFGFRYLKSVSQIRDRSIGTRTTAV